MNYDAPKRTKMFLFKHGTKLKLVFIQCMMLKTSFLSQTVIRRLLACWQIMPYLWIGSTCSRGVSHGKMLLDPNQAREDLARFLQIKGGSMGTTAESFSSAEHVLDMQKARLNSSLA